MANFTTVTNISPTTFVPISSRYAKGTVVYYTENNLITFQIYKKQNIALTKNDKFAVVTTGTEYRPDLVSKAAYGTVDFWWKIMEANGIKDIFDFKAGLNIRIPDTLL